MTERSSYKDPAPITLPLLPLRDIVVFPNFVIPLFVGRESSLNALNKVDEERPLVFLVAQIDSGVEEPSIEDIYSVGTVAEIMHTVNLPDDTQKVMVRGLWRAEIDTVTYRPDYLDVSSVPLASKPMNKVLAESLMESLLGQFERYVKATQKIPADIISKLTEIESPSHLVDVVAAHLVSQTVAERQEILEMTDEQARLEQVLSIMASDVELQEVERKIRGRVKQQMEKSQREYYLNEQLKAIHKELGNSEETKSETVELAEKIAKSGMTKEAREKAESELGKLKMMSPMSAEATVVRNYIEWLLAVPWKKRSRMNRDLNAAEKVLDEDHYGLEKVKERILEYLAVQQRVRKNKGPILCLVGPPGVGKTSLGQSVARATKRKFVRMSLGGVRDEAEIRGHRRTYIGSLPGKIIQNLAKIKHKNPLFMLDEVDKMSMDFRGDPSSALLEVLDPEQNHTFGDHYLEVEYDLSEVMFIATANTLNIPPPLLDRMEVIRISGYTEEEKLEIAKHYLIPKQYKNNGIKRGEVDIRESVLRDIIRYYTREAGVRALEREISKICRKVTRKFVQNPKAEKPVELATDNLDEFLGVRQFRFGRADKVNQIGQVTGLAWTQTGGDLLSVEAVVVPGKGKQIYTGKLGVVMQESIHAALSVVRSRAHSYGIEPDFYEKMDIHIHVPEGATPKDGPSAGVAMSVAIISALTGIPVLAAVAMTGEITLRGEILQIGGLKEKLLAAHRGQIDTVLIPQENEKDLVEIPDKVKEELDIIAVRWIDDIVKLSFESSLEERAKPSSGITMELESEVRAGDAVAVTKH